jgi:hypothetical protein
MYHQSILVKVTYTLRQFHYNLGGESNLSALGWRVTSSNDTSLNNTSWNRVILVQNPLVATWRVIVSYNGQWVAKP